MKLLSSMGTGIAALSIVAAVASTGATNANPSRSFLPRGAAHAGPGPMRSNRKYLARPHAFPTACSATGTNSFIGVQNSNDVAAGQSSAVLGGGDNQACDDDTAIGAGVGNAIGGQNAATDSFIGGGYENTVTGQYAAIASGENNVASANGAFIGAGGTQGANTASGLDSVVGGGDSNVASGQDSVVTGGIRNHAAGTNAFVGGGDGAQALGDDSFAGAGQTNTAGAVDSFIGAGTSNTIAQSSSFTFIGSGVDNMVSGAGSFIGSGGFTVFAQHGLGYPNTVSGTDSFIGSGDQNSVAADEAFLGSGANNTISRAATYGSLIGGRSNTVSAVYGTVIGGYANTASGQYAIVAGGDSDTAAGILTFAAGYHADATHNGSFIWSDYVSGSTPLKDTAANQFLVRASGGTSIYSNEAATAGVKLAPGSGTWSSLSDRNAKTGIVPLDDASVLAKIDALPVNAWSYTSEKGVRHVGPMAQDFYAAFGVGEDDRHITSIDEEGAALAAIKALHSENAMLRTKLGAIEAANALAERREAQKDRDLAALENGLRKVAAVIALRHGR